MARGRRREQWRHTSHVLAAIVNANRGPSQGPVSPAELNPFLAKDVAPKRRMKDPRQLGREFGALEL